MRMVCCLLAVCCLMVPVVASAETLPDPVVQEVEAKDGVKGLKASFEVNQPRAVVFALLNDLKAFPKIFPNVLQIKVLRTEGNTRDVYFQVDAVLSKAEYTLRRSATTGKTQDRIVWELISGDPNVVRGSWTLVDGDTPNTTKLLYQSFVDVSAMVPTAVVRDIALGKVKDMARRIRQHAATYHVPKKP